MTVIFLAPLVVSIACVLRYLLAGERPVMKLVGLAVVAASLALQFVPVLRVHFLIPLFMQIIVILIYSALWKLEE